MAKACNHRKREVLQTLQGMVSEIEARRLLLLAVLDDKPQMAEEVASKISFLTNGLDSINLTLDFIEEACSWCQHSSKGQQAA